MRIAYTCHDSLPSADTNTQQTFWTVVEVARLGVTIDLVVPSVTVGPDGDPRRSLASFYGVAIDEWPETLRVTPLGSTAANGSLRKGWFDWNMARRLRASSEPVDLVWTRDPVAAASCVRAGLPTLFETYRPDYATRGVFRAWRNTCLASPHLRGVVTHSELAADAYCDAGVPMERVLVAHNGFAPSLLEPRLSREDARQRLDLPLEANLAVYAGHVGPEKGMDTLIDLAADVPSVTVVIVGAAPDSEDGRRLRQAAHLVGAKNVVLRGRVAIADVSTYLYAADCLLIPPTDAPLRRFRRTVLPMKVFMFLAAGRPILAGQLPDVGEVLRNGETARLVAPDNRQEAAAALVGLFADSDLRGRLSRNALKAAAGFTWAARARRIVAFLNAA